MTHIAIFFWFLYSGICLFLCFLCKVEMWLNRVLDTMRSTVRHEMTEAVIAYEEKPREQWLFDYSAQVNRFGLMYDAVKNIFPLPVFCNSSFQIFQVSQITVDECPTILCRIVSIQPHWKVSRHERPVLRSCQSIPIEFKFGLTTNPKPWKSSQAKQEKITPQPPFLHTTTLI